MWAVWWKRAGVSINTMLWSNMSKFGGTCFRANPRGEKTLRHSDVTSVDFLGLAVNKYILNQ